MKEPAGNERKVREGRVCPVADRRHFEYAGMDR
jgi:hypothetical protein